MRNFGFLFVLVFLLVGCSRKDPVNNIVNDNINAVNEALDYANNHLENSPDMNFMKNALKNCKTGLASADEAHKAVVATCEAKVDYWRLATFCIGSILVLFLIYTFRGGIRKILHL